MPQAMHILGGRGSEGCNPVLLQAARIAGVCAVFQQQALRIQGLLIHLAADVRQDLGIEQPPITRFFNLGQALP